MAKIQKKKTPPPHKKSLSCTFFFLSMQIYFTLNTKGQKRKSQVKHASPSDTMNATKLSSTATKG